MTVRAQLPQDPAIQAAQLAQSIEAEQQATVASRHEIAAAVEATQSLQQGKHDSDLVLLGTIRDRAAYLMDLRRQVEMLERENLRAEINIISAIRANIMHQATIDADRLLIGKLTNNG